MFTSPEAAIWFLPSVTPIAIWVALTDMKDMRIPNVSVLALLAVFLIVGPIVLPLYDWGLRWVHLVVVLAVTFTLNIAGILGGGDAKFMAAMAPFVARQDALPFLFILAVASLLAVLLHRLIGQIPPIKRATEHWKSWQNLSAFPYGLALSIALVTYLLIASRILTIM